MRILFLTPYTPNPIRVRSYEFLRTLVQRGHEINLASLYTSAAEQDDLERLRQIGVSVLAQPMPVWRSAANSLLALPSPMPLQAVYSWQPALFASLRKLLAHQQFDAIHVEHLRGSRYGLELLLHFASQTVRPPIIWDSVDCISHLFQQAAARSLSTKSKMITRFELPRTQRYEAHLVNSFDSTVVTSAIDKAALVHLSEQFAPDTIAQGRIDVVPNGVDLDHFAYCGLDRRYTNRVVFSGKMSYHANVTAALYLINDIMPQVWAQRPDAEAWIVGKDPAPELRRLENAVPGTPSGACSARRVVVTGEVPAMQDYIQSATVAVAPLLYGAGIQNKVLEAMACGTPVVASAQASQALSARPGQDFLLATSAEEFATAILSLLNAPDRRTQFGYSGRQFVVNYHSWDGSGQQLEAIYTACAARLSSPSVTI